MSKKEHDGLRLSSTSVVLLVITILVTLFTVNNLLNVSKRYDELTSSYDVRTDATDAIHTLNSASDSLTENARLFVITQDEEFLKKYLQEVNEDKHRENSINSLSEILPSSKSALISDARDALNRSEELIDIDIHAFKLICEFTDISPSLKRGLINDYKLTDEELSMDDASKLNAAYYLVYGSDYRSKKAALDEKILAITNTINSLTRTDKNTIQERLHSELIQQSIYITLLILIIAIVFTIVFLYVLRPLSKILDSIKNREKFKVSGTREFRTLANTYNGVLAINTSTQTALQKKAERDALTGIMNRGAFNQVCIVLRTTKDPLALLLIDIDNFKTVNDKYGHDIGDLAIKKVAAALKNTFRSKDYVARFGGDEFAVLMTDSTQEMEETISSKINKINAFLSSPDSDLVPPISISVGIAFSTWGYDDVLFNRADKALYITKENGRNGYTFYKSESKE